jgi:hypothetical protein
MEIRFDLAPLDGLDQDAPLVRSDHLTFGSSSSCQRAELMLALVTRVAPVEKRSQRESPTGYIGAGIVPPPSGLRSRRISLNLA